VEPPEVPLPETYQEGREIFRKNCKVCHGPSATGTSQGPPLLHPYYNPNKHGDARLVRVIQEGTEQHLWEFGDMPPQPQMDREKARQVLDYIRWLQRQADIY
jgi:mono/diheme cytochrome c family protein